MFVAVDKEGNRVYADAPSKITECYCQGCGEKLTHRTGKVNAWHFSHQKDSNCKWAEDKDSKSIWHRRMQDYFAKENQEVRFVDEATGAVHIADVYIPEKNIVIEFQHSPIEIDEFISRTTFHINNGRRIAWVFDESSDVKGQIGRFKEEEFSMSDFPYRTLKWMRSPRKCLKGGPNIYQYADRYSIHVFHGAEKEGDVIHRIVREYGAFESVDFSFCNIKMEKDMNADLLFVPDTYWQTVEPFKTAFDEYKEKQKKRQRALMASAYSPVRLKPQRNFHF